jgi:ectoine hydroxylase-related dioxygenase (phytanoyl-CoA dioxygenase family)
MTDAGIRLSDQEIAQYRRDGAGLFRGILDRDMMKEAQRVFQWSLDHPSPVAQRYYGSGEVVFYQDLFNTRSWPEYRTLFTESRLPDLLQSLWRAEPIWFFFEQVFYKTGGETRRTPWHQDTSYFPIAGEHHAVVWLCLDRVSQADSLEFVRGSHLQTLYNGSSFSDDDDTAPLYPENAMPRLPDIEKERDRWDIVSFPVEPGDVVLFHPSALHGGAPTHPDGQRRTISLRYFGPDATFVERPGVRKESNVGFNREAGDSRNIEEFYEGLKPGEPFRNPAFHQVRPRA